MSSTAKCAFLIDNVNLSYPTESLVTNCGSTGRDYPFGFDNMEELDELYGDANAYDFGARLYDPRIGRWFARDPLAGKYPDISPYVAFAGNPIYFIDTDGRAITPPGTPPARIAWVLNLLTQTDYGKQLLAPFSSDQQMQNSFEGNMTILGPPLTQLEMVFGVDPTNPRAVGYTQVFVKNIKDQQWVPLHGNNINGVHWMDVLGPASFNRSTQIKVVIAFSPWRNISNMKLIETAIHELALHWYYEFMWINLMRQGLLVGQNLINFVQAQERRPGSLNEIDQHIWFVNSNLADDTPFHTTMEQTISLLNKI